MINAAKQNNVTALKTLLSTSNININSTDDEGMTALMWAALKGHLETAQCLVTAGAELEAKTEYGTTALMFSAQEGHLAVAQCLVTAGAELDAKTEYGTTALMRAAEKGHLETAQFLVTAGAEMEVHGSWTALMWAAIFGQVEKVQHLVGDGADLNAKNERGSTALMLAAMNGHLAVAQYLIGAGAELNAKTTGFMGSGMTSLMWAAQKGHVAVAQCLVTAGAELNAKTEKGSTALMLAAENGHLETAQCLVTAGAELEAKTTEYDGGRTALMFAAENGHLETAKFLVTAGAELNAKYKNGCTALMLAAQKGYVAVAQYLVYSGKPWASSMRQLPNYDVAITELDQFSGTTVLTSIRANIVSLKDMLLGGGAASLDMATCPHRIKLLKARICGVVFPEDFTQKLSGMPLEKFNHIVPLMRAAKIAKLLHGVNAYFFTRIFMLESSTSSVLAKSPFTDLVVQRNLLGFVLGKTETRTLTRELQAISSLSIAPASKAAALGGASEPKHSAAAQPCKKSL